MVDNHTEMLVIYGHRANEAALGTDHEICHEIILGDEAAAERVFRNHPLKPRTKPHAEAAPAFPVRRVRVDLDSCGDQVQA